MDLISIENQISSCNKCPRLRAVSPYPFSYVKYGELKNIDLIILARNPGLEHEYHNIEREKVFSIYHDLWWNCNIGRYIRKRLGNKIVKERMLFTNVCKCSSPRNEKLLSKEKENCLPFTMEIFNIVKPKYLITLGDDAKKINLNVENVWNLYHPSFFNYQRDNMKESKQNDIFEMIKLKMGKR